MAFTFPCFTCSICNSHLLSNKPWEDPLNLFIWLLYALLIFSGMSYSSIYLLKKNYRKEIQMKQEREELEKKHLKALIQKHIQTQEHERKRIGSDLHDSISNKLSLILLKANRGYTVEQLEQDIKETLFVVRDIAHDLNPPFYEQAFLHVLILTQFQKLSAHYRLTKCCKIHERLDWSTNCKIQLIRIVQELMTNLIKHAKATTVHLDLRESKKGMYLLFEDNGIGGVDEHKGLGYENIRNRLFLIQGKMKISSKENMGTKIIICIQNEI